MARRFSRGRELGSPQLLRGRYFVRLLKGRVANPTLAQINRAVQVHRLGKKANRARISAKAHTARATTARDAILSGAPFEPPFVIVSEHAGNKFATRVTEVVSQPVADPGAALDYLGRYEGRVIRGYTIKPSSRRGRRHALRLLRALRAAMPRAFNRMVELDYDPDALQRLIEQGRRPEPPANVLARAEVSYRLDFPDPDNL